MFWWIVIALVVSAAVIYAYREDQRDSRQLAALFAGLAEKYGGQVESGGWLYFPRLRFELGGRRCLLTAMATDGSEGGSPFTSMKLELPSDSGETIRIRPVSAVSKHVDVAALFEGRLSTGDRDFDEAFHVKGSSQVVVSGLLGADVRRQLLSSRALRFEAHVEGAKIAVTMDGIARSAEDLEALIETARLLADHRPGTVALHESTDS